MKRRIAGIFSRTTLIALEVAAAVVGLVFLGAGFLIWRLTSPGGVDAGFARSYVEQALNDPVSGYSVALDSIAFRWPDLAGPIVLQLGGVGLIKNGAEVLEVRSVTLDLAARYLFIGDFKPIAIALEKPTLQMIRTEGNEFRLSLEDERPATAVAEGEKDPLMQMIDTLAQPAGTVDKRSPLDNLESIEITGAKMAVADYLMGVTWFLSPIDLAFARDAQGLLVTASAELPGGRNGATRIYGDLVYRRATQDFAANIHVQDFDPHILSRKIEQLGWLNDHEAVVNGNIEAVFSRDLEIRSAAVLLSSVDGFIDTGGVYDAPLPFEELYLEAVYDKAQALADIRSLSIKTSGVTVRLSAPVKITEVGASAPVVIAVPELAQDKIAGLWPAALRGEGAEEWLLQKLSKGRFYDAAAQFDLSAQKKEGDVWSFAVDNITADFFIENMDIDYRAPLRPIAAASGKGRFEKDILTIDIEKGALGDISVVSGKATIDKVIEGKGTAKIEVSLDGPLASVLRYIGDEPIGVSEERLGLKIAEVKGNAKLDVGVSFPTIKDLLAEQVKVSAKGTLTEALLPDVVATLDLTGGPFTLGIADGAATLSGKGALEGRAIEFSWKEFVESEGKPFSSQVKAKLGADKAMREALGIGVEDWIEGSFPVDVTYTEFGGGRAEAQASVDLASGSVKIAPLDYVRPPGTAGKADIKVLFDKGEVQEISSLSVDAAPLRLRDARFIFSKIAGKTEMSRASIPEFVLNENQFSVDIEAPAPGRLKMVVGGAFLDARPFLDDKKSTEAYTGPAILASINVARMRTTPARMIDKVKAYLDMNAKGDVSAFELDAVAGQGAIYLRLKPNDRGVMAIRLEADDAGETLRAFDMYENVKGGKLVLNGVAANPAEPKILRGTAQMTDFYVVRAPALAQLVSAIGFLNITQLLSGDGIYFSRLESDFEWHINRKGDQYYAKNGRTSGSSLGLTFEGRVDKSIDLIRMEGTVVPVSLLSEIIGGIPLIGDILTGGGGGLIAATYKIEGPIKQPQVSVNPLSILAPGILRQILFESD